MGVLDDAGSLASVLAAIEQGRANGRVSTATVNQNQAKAASDIYKTQSDVALKGPTLSAKSAALGDEMANIQPFQWTGDTKMIGNLPVPQSSGGLTPANFGPATRTAGANLAALSANRVTDPAFNVPSAPVLPPVPSSNALDSILGTAGSLGSIAGALGKAANGSGAGGDLGKLLSMLKGKPSLDATPYGAEQTGFNLPAGGSGSNVTGASGDTSNVDTSTTFNGVKGGYPNNPEDPASADPNFWEQFLQGDGSNGLGLGPDPSSTWGG